MAHIAKGSLVRVLDDWGPFRRLSPLLPESAAFALLVDALRHRG
jgi:hypothetical protein